MTPLARLLRARIAETGPISVADYMEICLAHPEHGYYRTRDPLGARGDFVTAPEISQMFGEILGLWTAQVWADQGRPDPFVLAELGPGRGTLMHDALRAAARMAGFSSAVRLWLIETSPPLRAQQANVLSAHDPNWAEEVSGLPDGPLVVLANEFFDALPVLQFQRTGHFWRERRVGLDNDGLGFVWSDPRPDAALEAGFSAVPDGAVIETCPAGAAIAAEIGARIARHGGAALIVDYGAWDGHGDTLQALAGHARAVPLARPGEADLTAHVRFRALAEAAGRGLRVGGPMAQGEFLERLGITARARALARGVEGAAVAAIVAQHRRLTHPDEMGHLFRIMTLSPHAAPAPPGIEP